MDNTSLFIKSLKKGQVGILVTPELTYKIKMLDIYEKGKIPNGCEIKFVSYDEVSHNNK